jgi:hypothetical protein
MSFNEFIKSYFKDEAHKMVLHFRFGTGGVKGLTNVHPFALVTDLKKASDAKNADAVLAHNGIMYDFDVSGSDYCDTVHFTTQLAELLWPQLSVGNIPTGFIQTVLAGANKLVLFDKLGNHQIFNEHLGHWDNGVWYSNHTYQGYKSGNPASNKHFGFYDRYDYPKTGASYYGDDDYSWYYTDGELDMDNYDYAEYEEKLSVTQKFVEDTSTTTIARTACCDDKVMVVTDDDGVVVGIAQDNIEVNAVLTQKQIPEDIVLFNNKYNELMIFEDCVVRYDNGELEKLPKGYYYIDVMVNKQVESRGIHQAIAY